jgi:hypothetical protein
LIFEGPRYAAFLDSLMTADALRLLNLVYSVYLDPDPDGEHVFDYSTLGTPEFRYAFDGEFRLDFLVVSETTVILLDATRARRLGPK